MTKITKKHLIHLQNRLQLKNPKPNKILQIPNLYSLGKEPIFLGQSSDTIVGFTHSPDFTTDCVNFGCVQHTASLWVDINNVDLD